MPSADFERAQMFLRKFIGKTLSAIECDEFHVELVFEDSSRFGSHGSWRVVQGGTFLFGSGDVGGQVPQDVLREMIGLKVIKTSISNRSDTDLQFEKDFIFEAIMDAVQYETWEAHLDVGWVIFSNGSVTVFPPAPVAPVSAPTS
jgi:hypothetical protein